MPGCCSCAPAAADLDEAVADLPEEVEPCRCFNKAEKVRRSIKRRRHGDSVLLTGTTGHSRRVWREKLDPCNPAVDAFLADCVAPEPCLPRVCRRASFFRAQTDREAQEMCYSLGLMNELATPWRSEQCRGTLGLGNGTSKTYGDLVTKSHNLLCRPPLPCRQPSMFTCSTDRCQAALCYQLGLTNELNDQQYRVATAGCTTKGLGGGRDSDQKTYEDLCIGVVRYGPPL